MAQQLYVVFGATGHVGSIVANRLLEQKKAVRVVGRSLERLKAFTDRGATAAVGSLEDAAFVKTALAGATAVYAMIPPNFATPDFLAYQKKVVANLGDAIEAVKPQHVLTLSSIGAHLPQGNGPVAGLYLLEQRLNAISGIHVLHARPGYFMENLLGNLGMIKAQGINGGAMASDVPIKMIATRDIGEVCAKRLAALDFTGASVLELMGAHDVTMTDATRAIGQAIGKPELQYIQFPYEDARKAMVGMGIPEQMAGLYIEMTRGFNEGTINATQPRTSNTTTPTTFEQFATTVVAPAFRA